MAIETYYFSSTTPNENASELVAYLNRYTEDFGYTITKTVLQESDVDVANVIDIYCSTGTVVDDFPIISIRLGHDNNSLTSVSYSTYVWVIRSVCDTNTSYNGVSATTANNKSRFNSLYAKTAYKTSNGIMILFAIKGLVNSTYSIILAKNNSGRLSLASLPLTRVINSNTDYDYQAVIPHFVGDSLKGNVQFIFPKQTPTSLYTSSGQDTFNRFIWGFSILSGRTVLAPVVGTEGSYSPYIFWRAFSETPGSIGLMECDGIKYVTDGFFALKE